MSRAPAPFVRRATASDAPAVATLGAATFVETFGHLYPAEDLAAFLAASKTPDAYAKMLADPDVFVLLAEDRSGEPLGYVLAGGCKLPMPDLDPRSGEVRELYLLSGQQGRGLGTRLLEAALEWLESTGRTPVYVGVWSENHGAQRLYARYGFEKVGEYDFPVGATLDREFILEQKSRRKPD